MNPIESSGNGETEEFSGNFIFSMNGLLLFGINLLFAWQGIDFYNRPDHGWKPFLVLIPILSFSAIFGLQLFYFRICGDQLEIRNHVFRWVRIRVRLFDIEKIVLYSPGSKTSNSLRIYKKDGSRTWGYSAGSLRDKTWIALSKAFAKKGIPVTNKLPYISFGS